MVLLLLYLPPTLLSHRLNASFRPRRLSAFSFRMLEAMIILFLSLPPPLNFSLHLVVCSYLSQLSLPSFSPILSVLTLLSSSWLQFHECRQTMCYGAVYTLAEQVALKWVAQRSSISKKTKNRSSVKAHQSETQKFCMNLLCLCKWTLITAIPFKLIDFGLIICCFESWWD